MLDNEPDRFREQNYPPTPNFKERDHLLHDAILYFLQIKSIFLELDHRKNYKNAFQTNEQEKLKKLYHQSLRQLFKEFARFDFFAKLTEGGILDAKTETLFKALHRSVLKFEKMPTSNLNFEGHISKLIQPIIKYLKTIKDLTKINLSKENLPKPDTEDSKGESE